MDPELYDTNIDFDIFIKAISKKLGDHESLAGIGKILSLFDENGSGTIDLRDMERAARELGETMTNDEIPRKIERANTVGDGEISLEDFYKIMVEVKPIDDFYSVLIFYFECLCQSR